MNSSFYEAAVGLTERSGGAATHETSKLMKESQTHGNEQRGHPVGFLFQSKMLHVSVLLKTILHEGNTNEIWLQNANLMVVSTF